MIKTLLSLMLLMIVTSVGAVDTINFKFTDVRGQTFDLKSYRGNWVVVNFFAPWCPLCWVEVPTLNRINKRPDVVVIGIAMDYNSDEQSVLRVIDQHGLRFDRYVFGGSRRLADGAFRQIGPVDFFPTSYVYDPQGNVVMFIPGQFREETLNKFIASHK